MKRESFLAFDDYIEDTQSTYSSTELNNALGACDAFVLQVVTDDVVGATAITVQLEVSSDGRRWVNKNAVPEINAAALSSGATNNAQGLDPGTIGPESALVRVRVQLTNPFGGTTRAHVKVYCRGGEPVGPFQPNHLQGAVLWLRADRGVTLSTGSNVSTWADQSGAGNHAATGPTPPTYGIASNGLPRLTAGTGGYMTGSFATSVQAHTLFAVLSYPALADRAAFAGLDSGFNVNSGFSQFCELGTGINGRTASAAGSFVSAITVDTSSLGTLGIYSTAADNNSSVDLWINGVAKASTSAAFTLFSCTRYMLFALGIPLQYNFTGDAFEFILYSRVLQAQERSLVHGYLGARYGVAIP